MRTPIRFHAPVRGQLIVMLALFLVVLLGVAALVLDLGIYYREKANLQNVTDAAALSACVQLPDTTAAQTTVHQVLQENGYVLGQGGLIGVDAIPNPDGLHPARYLVRMRRNMPPFLSVFLGYHGSLIQTEALAVFVVKGIVPWIFYLPDTMEFDYENPYTLKTGPLGVVTGNFGCLRLTAPGADAYREDVIYGYQGFVEMGQMLTTQPGNVAGPTKVGVDERIRNGDLIVICPATYSAVPEGASVDVRLDGFCAFRLSDAYKVADTCYVYATFINYKTVPWAQGGVRTCLIR